MARLLPLLAALLLATAVNASQNDSESPSEQFIKQGDLLLDQDKVGEAINAYKSAVRSDPSLSRPHQKLGHAYLIAGDLDSARHESERAVSLDSKNAEAYADLGRAHGLQQNYREAAAAINRSISLDPQNTDAYVILGTALAYLGDYERSISAYQKVIQLEPRNIAGYVNLAGALGRKGEYAGAISLYRKALTLNSNSFAAYLGLGAALGNVGDTEGQIKALKQAIKLRPDSDAAHGRLGWALSQKGDWQGALREGCVTNWLRLKKAGPEYLQSFISLWGGIFLLFGLIFAVVFFGSRFKPDAGETIIGSYFLVLHQDKPGRFVITNKRLVYVPEAFSRWFGSKELSIPLVAVSSIEYAATSMSGTLVVQSESGKDTFTLPILVLNALVSKLPPDVVKQLPDSATQK